MYFLTLMKTAHPAGPVTFYERIGFPDWLYMCTQQSSRHLPTAPRASPTLTHTLLLSFPHAEPWQMGSSAWEELILRK